MDAEGVIALCSCGNIARPNQRNCLGCHAIAQRNYRRNRTVTHDQHAKELARSKAGVKYRRGNIKKSPCRDCGSEMSQMHHEDYSKPYDVVWMCRGCHLKVHAVEHRQAVTDLAAVVRKYTRSLWARL
jgi:hypothetical protein